MQALYPMTNACLRHLECASDPLPAGFAEVQTINEPLWNLELRAALYERAYLNLFVNNGPSYLSFFNKRSRCLDFKMVTPGCGATTERFFRSIGIEPRSQLPVFTPFQRLVWEDDRLEVIQREFQAMCRRIEASERQSALAGS